MRLLTIKFYLTDNELKRGMNSQKRADDFRDYQIIYSIRTNIGIKAEDISGILGITKNKIYKTVEKYNKYGLSWKSGKTKGGRRASRCILSLEEEASFLKKVEQEALKGKIVTFRRKKDKLVLQIKRQVSDDYIWDLFKRHHWRKKVPCQSHPQAAKDVHEE